MGFQWKFCVCIYVGSIAYAPRIYTRDLEGVKQKVTYVAYDASILVLWSLDIYCLDCSVLLVYYIPPGRFVSFSIDVVLLRICFVKRLLYVCTKRSVGTEKLCVDVYSVDSVLPIIVPGTFINIVAVNENKRIFALFLRF